MGSFDGLHVQVHDARFGVTSHRRIPRVGQWARLAITQAADIVFIAAEVLIFGCSEWSDELISPKFLFFLVGAKEQ